MSEPQRQGVGWDVPWVAGLPGRWEVRRMRHALRLSTNRNDDGSRDDLLSLSVSKGLIPKGYGDESQVRSGYELRKYFLVRPGQFVVNPMWLMHGSLGMTAIHGVISPDYRVYDPAPGVEPRYVHHLLKTREYQELYGLLARGTTTYDRRISNDAFNDLPLLLPPFSTQKAIAAFLDRKTAAIDALIEKKRKLLDLLAERRAALINQAVTNGLDPSVPMKDSGIPWIGEIPVHWEVKRLKHVSSFVTSGPRGWGQYYSDFGPLFLRITNLARDGIDLLLEDDKRQCVSPPLGAEGMRTLALRGDVLVSITADLGSVGVVPAGLGEAYISQHVALCRPARPMESRLLAHMVRGPWGRVHYDLAMNGGTKVGLTLDDVRNTPVAVPPKAEQIVLLAQVDGALGQLDKAGRSLMEQIERIQEYRQALITAAVTGRLDIPREEVTA